MKTLARQGLQNYFASFLLYVEYEGDVLDKTLECLFAPVFWDTLAELEAARSCLPWETLWFIGWYPTSRSLI